MWLIYFLTWYLYPTSFGLNERHPFSLPHTSGHLWFCHLVFSYLCLYHANRCYDNWNLAPMPPISRDHLRDVRVSYEVKWSPLVVNSTEWPWFGKANTCCYKVSTAGNASKSKNQAMRLKKLPAGLRQDCVKAQSWRRLQRILMHWRFLGAQWAP